MSNCKDNVLMNKENNNEKYNVNSNTITPITAYIQAKKNTADDISSTRPQADTIPYSNTEGLDLNCDIDKISYKL